MPIREDIEKSVKIKVDTIEEKMNNIINTLDNTTYYVATINNLDIDIMLFDKLVKKKTASEQIKISREKFNELKNQKYFFTEITKDEPDGKRIIGIETIIKPADVTHHHNLEEIISQPDVIIQPSKIITTSSTLTSTSISTFEHLKMDRTPSIYQQDIFTYIQMLGNNDPRATQKHLVVEAVAGCISGNSIVYTNNGLITIKELYDKKSKNIKVACSDRNGGTEFKEIEEYFKLEDKDIIKITTKFGFELKCTPEHKLLTLDKNGMLGFIEAKNLNINDTISIYYNANSFGENQKMRWDVGQSLMSDYLSEEESEKLPEMNKGIISYGNRHIHGSNISCTYPYIMNEELAEFLGYFISEGNLHREMTVSISNTDDKINERINYLYKNLFNLDSNVIIEKRRENAEYGRTINSVGLSRFLELIGLNEKSKDKSIPIELLRSSKEVHISFLKALFSGDGYITKESKSVGYSSMSKKLCYHIHLMLLNLGIFSSLNEKDAYCNDKYCGISYFITLYGNDVLKFRDIIGFNLEYRQNDLNIICKHIEEDGTWSSRTLKGLGLYISKIYDEFKKLGSWNDIREYYLDEGVKSYRCYSARDALIKRGCSDIRGNVSERRCPSKQKLYKILIAMKECNYMDEYKYLMNLCNLNIEYESIELIEYGKEDVYDLNIRDFHHYIANGFVVHNSGKTYTIEQATKLVPRNKTACFLAFNKHIVKEFKPRAPEFIKDNVMTLNSAGFQLVLYGLRTRGHGKKLSQTDGVDANNVSLILDELFNKKYKHFSIEEIDAIKPPVNRLVSLLKGSGLEINYTNLTELIEKYNIEYENVELSDIMMLCKNVMEINRDIFNNTWNKIDFDDQIWLPLELDISAEKAGYQFDYVFIDETQDLNMAKIELAIKMCKQNGSIIAVGDRYQSIYGFTGADSEAIPKIITRLQAKVFPLSICYRCPKSHVILAQQFVPHIEYATLQNSIKEAIEGSIEDIGLEKLIKDANNGDKVICRNSAPLVHPCFELIRHGKKATILGRDIGKQLENLMIKIKGKTLNDFMNRLERWKEKQVEKLESKNLSIDRVMDQYETLKVLSEDCDEIEEVLAKIKAIFSDNDKEGIIFSTIHKAKGLEVETKENSVYIIMSYNGKALMPSPWAKKPWEFEQERNLQYVAYTRGKNRMYLVDKV